MATSVSNLCDMMHRATTSCILRPFDLSREAPEEDQSDEHGGLTVDGGAAAEPGEQGEDLLLRQENRDAAAAERAREMEDLMAEVFETVSAMKRAYVKLQEAHCPWDPVEVRSADAAVVAGLKRLIALRERFRRGRRRQAARRRTDYYREGSVEPYEAALEDLKREMRAKEAELVALKEQLRDASRGRLRPSRRRPKFVAGPPAVPTSDLFLSCMKLVKEACKSFSVTLLSIMNSAHCDISATMLSFLPPQAQAVSPPPHHANHIVESYVTRKLFKGFENESFYLEGSLSSLLQPEKFRRDCFSQFRDMKAMDPVELLGISPSCHFGKFSSHKYLSVVSAEMEEFLFKSLEQRRAVEAGDRPPRSSFYTEFLRVAKAVWLLHLLAFSLDPAPIHFEASCGVDFYPEYMESVIRRFAVRGGGGGGGSGGALTGQNHMKVGFTVSPGFKLATKIVIKVRVYLVNSATQS